MNAPTHAASLIPTVPGTPFGGGFYAGRLLINDHAFALLVAPKFDGQRDDVEWNIASTMVDGALSFCDGRANTIAMAAAGSDIAKWALDLRIGGHDDWYLPSVDELEIAYRNLKPTEEENTLYARSGINVSALWPTFPYTAALPAQTADPAFQDDGEQAFDERWYWTSTQHAANSGYAWSQYFYYGYQLINDKSSQLRARAVRRLPI